MTEYIDAYLSFMEPILFHGPLAYFITAGILLVLSEGLLLAVARYKGEDDNVLIVLPMFGLALASLAWGAVIMLPFALLLMGILSVVFYIFCGLVTLLFKGVDKLKAHNEAKAAFLRKEAKRLRDIERRRKFDESQRSAGVIE
jgi:predicted membrane protein